MDLDNVTQSEASLSEGDSDMAKIRQPITLNGVTKWISASSMQEFADKIIQLSVPAVPQPSAAHPFAAYAWNWFNTYSAPNIGSTTKETYKRQLNLYLIPNLGSMNVEDITTDSLQMLFNGMSGAKATKDKVRLVLNQILDAAVEDKLLPNNPLKSRRLRINGNASRATVPYSVEQMQYLISHIDDVKMPMDRAYIALQALHPMRLEEVLGLKGADIDRTAMEIHICRAVTHPDRNRPEIKDTKTEASHRTIGLVSIAVPYLPDVPDDQYVIGGDAPLSYTMVRHMCERIRKDTGFDDKITPIRFRTTVLTDIYDKTKDIKLTQAAAGHTTATMTLKHYVKGREVDATAASVIEQRYAG